MGNFTKIILMLLLIFVVGIESMSVPDEQKIDNKDYIADLGWEPWKERVEEPIPQNHKCFKCWEITIGGDWPEGKIGSCHNKTFLEEAEKALVKESALTKGEEAHMKGFKQVEVKCSSACAEWFIDVKFPIVARVMFRGCAKSKLKEYEKTLKCGKKVAGFQEIFSMEFKIALKGAWTIRKDNTFIKFNGEIKVLIQKGISKGITTQPSIIKAITTESRTTTTTTTKDSTTTKGIFPPGGCWCYCWTHTCNLQPQSSMKRLYRSAKMANKGSRTTLFNYKMIWLAALSALFICA